MKKRKSLLLNELESIQIELIEIQYQLDTGKRKPVPTIPIIYPEEVQKDPFEVYFLCIFSYHFAMKLCLNFKLDHQDMYQDFLILVARITKQKT